MIRALQTETKPTGQKIDFRVGSVSKNFEKSVSGPVGFVYWLKNNLSVLGEYVVNVNRLARLCVIVSCKMKIEIKQSVDCPPVE